jgi:hypothetical protein
MTESKRESILRKVRGLMAKAQSTEHEGERQVFMAKADELMEQYAIETWMLETGKDSEQARLIVRRQLDIAWWFQMRGVHHDARSEVWWLFDACVRHCRCYTSASAWDVGTKTVAVYGLEADLDYLDLLFTDLLVQLSSKIRPTYDPNKSMGENVMIAKEAGMKYTAIAVWLGYPEWRVPNGSGGYKTADKGKMLREYKKHLASIGKSVSDVVTVHPDAWAISYCAAFRATIQRRFREMSGARESGSNDSQALVLRDIRLQAQEAMYQDFPDLRPHPEGCECETCKPKKALKYREGHRTVSAAYYRGGEAGANARIASRNQKLGGSKQLDH